MVHEYLIQAVEALPLLLEQKNLNLDQLVEKLRPWLESKGLGLVRTNPHAQITWSRGAKFGVETDDNKEELRPKPLTRAEISGFLDHIAIVTANYTDLREAPEQDRLVLAVIANLASALTEEVMMEEQPKAVLSAEDVRNYIEKPLSEIGLRLVELG